MVEWVRQNRETDEEHDEDCVEEEFQLARVKYVIYFPYNTFVSYIF